MGGLRKGTMDSTCLSVWEKTVLQLLPWCQTLQFLPECHWCLPSYYPSVGALREWVWVSLCMGSLGGTASDSRNFFHQLSLPWFLQPTVMRTYLLGTGTLSWGDWCGARTPQSWDILPKFLHMDVGPAHSAPPPILPVWMDVITLIS